MFSLSEIKQHVVQNSRPDPDEEKVDALTIELELARRELESKSKEVTEWEAEVSKYRTRLSRKEREVLASNKHARYYNLLLKRLVCTRFCMSFIARKKLRALHTAICNLIIELSVSKLEHTRKRVSPDIRGV